MSILRRRSMAWAYEDLDTATAVAQALIDTGLGITAMVSTRKVSGRAHTEQWCVMAEVPTRPIYAAAAPDPDDDDDFHVDSSWDHPTRWEDR